MKLVCETSIPERFGRVARRHPDRIAVRTEEAAWTYTELDAVSTVLAGRMLSQAGPDQAPVALLMEPAAPLIAATLGVLKAGRIYVGLDVGQPPQRLRSMLQDCGARLLLTDTRHIPLAKAAAHEGLRVEVFLSPQAGSMPTPTLPEVSPEAGAWLTYTSGVTGTPKGVWRNHASVVHHAEVYARLIGVRPDDRFTLLTSLGLAASATPLFTALLHGACVCPFDLRARGIERLGEWLNRQEITVAHAVPTVFRRLLRAMPAGCGYGPLRFVRLGGEAVLRGDLEALRKSVSSDCVFMHALSSTETGLIAALLLDAQAPLPAGRVPVGRIVDGVEVVLLDEDGQAVAPGDEGRLVVRSAALAQGYWGRPVETQGSRFGPDPHDSRRRQFISGDLARFRADGDLELLGRLDEQVKLRGQRVDLTEIESALNRMEGVREAAVIVENKAGESPSLAAWLVAEPGTALTAQSCRRFLATLLPGFMIPRRILSRPSLPTTESGKVDRRTLEEEAKHVPATDRPNTRPMPRDNLEKLVARIWESVLGIEAIGRQENVFELGADSLHALEIVTRLSEALGAEFPAAVLMNHSTVESLAAEVARKTIRHSCSPLISLRAAPSGQPLFLVPTGGGHVSRFGQLVRYLPDQPVYGFQPPGLEGECWPLLSIPAIAGCYVRAIPDPQRSGPVMLAGVCVGGIVAFEMARQLVAQGCSVSMVVLIETRHPDPSGRGAPLRVRLHHAVRDGFRMLRWRLLRGSGLGRGPTWLPAYRRFIYHMYGRARRRYQPGFYPGRMGIVLAGDQTRSEADDPRLWMSRHAASTQTVVLPYSSAELFVSPAVRDLAATLRLWMETARAGHQPE